MRLNKKQKVQVSIDAAKAAGFIFNPTIRSTNKDKQEILYGCWHNSKQQEIFAWHPLCDVLQAVELARRMEFVIDFKSKHIECTTTTDGASCAMEFTSVSFAKIELEVAIVLLAAKIWGVRNGD